MKITKLKKTNQGTYKVTLENQERLFLYDDVILNHGLLYKQDIDFDQLKEVERDNAYAKIYHKVLRYISIKIRSQKEIRLYLEKEALSEIEQQTFLDKLISIGLINDEAYVKAYIADKLHLTNTGPYKIKQELLHHDIEESLIDQHLDTIELELLQDKINKLIAKKIASNHKYSGYLLRQKMITEFINLGYPKELILDCLSKHDLSNSGVLEKEYEKLYRKLSKKYESKELYYQIKNKLYQKGYQTEEIINMIENHFEPS